MITIELFTFSKRKNSTKRPTGLGLSASCELKEETSILSPSFELSIDASSFNYVKAFGKYYYISNCTYQTNFKWRIDCAMDSLATYAPQIKSTRAFIEYTNHYDDRIYDPRLAKKINAQEIEAMPTPLTSLFYDASGYYVVDVIGSNNAGAYVLGSMAALQSLMNNATQWWNDFANNTTWNDFGDSLQNIGKLFMAGDVSGCIKSARWIPAVASGLGTPQHVHLGIYDTEVDGAPVSYNQMNKDTFEITVPHPTNVMLRTSQTCEYTLYLPYVGNISLPADILADEEKIYIEASLAICTGEAAFRIYLDSGKTIGTYGATIGADVPVGSSGIGIRQVATAIGAVAVGAATAGAGVAAAAAGAEGASAGAAAIKGLTAAGAGLSQVQMTSSSVGGLGSCAAVGLDKNIRLTCSYWELSTDGSNLTNLIGNPYYKTDLIGNHGYVVCSGASVNIPAYDTVTNEINSYLGAGIYVE